MKTIRCTFETLEQTIEEFYETEDSEALYAAEILTQEKDHAVIYDQWYVEIPAVELKVHEGLYLAFDTERQQYLPDFSLTVVFEEDDSQPMYWEQDDIPVTLMNYCRMMRYPLNENTECLIRLPDIDELTSNETPE